MKNQVKVLFSTVADVVFVRSGERLDTSQGTIGPEQIGRIMRVGNKVLW